MHSDEKGTPMTGSNDGDDSTGIMAHGCDDSSGITQGLGLKLGPVGRGKTTFEGYDVAQVLAAAGHRGDATVFMIDRRPDFAAMATLGVPKRWGHDELAQLPPSTTVREIVAELRAEQLVVTDISGEGGLGEYPELVQFIETMCPDTGEGQDR